MIGIGKPGTKDWRGNRKQEIKRNHFIAEHYTKGVTGPRFLRHQYICAIAVTALIRVFFIK